MTPGTTRSCASGCCPVSRQVLHLLGAPSGIAADSDPTVKSRQRSADRRSVCLFRVLAGAGCHQRAAPPSACRRFFPAQPWWTVGLGILIAGLGNPAPFLLANASIYQTAIIGGQLFLLAGIDAAWLALDYTAGGMAGIEDGGNPVRQISAASPLPTAIRLFLTGTFWAMAVGCRISLAPTVLALSCFVAWRLWADRFRRRDMGLGRTTTVAGSLLWMALPLLAGAGLFGAYNNARFASPWEFGAALCPCRPEYARHGRGRNVRFGPVHSD